MVLQPVKEALFRGSCTCNIPTERAYDAANAAFKALQNEEVAHLHTYVFTFDMMWCLMTNHTE